MHQIAVAMLLTAALCGCAPNKSTLSPTTTNPGSAGTVTAVETTNGNTKLDVDLRYLPPPKALGSNTYVVWIRPQNGRFLNLGQVAIDDKRHGHLETTTPHKSFIVLVTAESDATASAPSQTVMLTGIVDKNKRTRPLR